MRTIWPLEKKVNAVNDAAEGHLLVTKGLVERREQDSIIDLCDALEVLEEHLEEAREFLNKRALALLEATTNMLETTRDYVAGVHEGSIAAPEAAAMQLVRDSRHLLELHSLYDKGL